MIGALPLNCPGRSLHGGRASLSISVAATDRERQFWRRVRQPVESDPRELRPDGRRSSRLARLEAALFVAGSPLPTRRLGQLAQLPQGCDVSGLLAELNALYDAAGTPFRVERVAIGFQLLTRPGFAYWLDRLHHRQERLRLSSSSLETLVVIAYRQPVTRAEVEAVRGVQLTEILKQLMERGLVRIVGEDHSLGRPYLYGTTRQFLEMFGLQSLDDLPLGESLRRTPPPDGASSIPDEAPDESTEADGRATGDAEAA